MIKSTMTKKKQKLPVTNIFIFILVIILFIGLFYMSSYFREKEEQVRAENPITFCPSEQECFFTTHIHYLVSIKIFGQEQTLGFEEGALESFHTHSQKNKVHWHALLQADSTTRQPEEFPTLGKLFESMNVPFSNEGIFEYKNGEPNPKTSKPAQLKVFVNGEQIENPEKYVLDLKEEQRIEVVFE